MRPVVVLAQGLRGWQEPWAVAPNSNARTGETVTDLWPVAVALAVPEAEVMEVRPSMGAQEEVQQHTMPDSIQGRALPRVRPHQPVLEVQAVVSEQDMERPLGLISPLVRVVQVQVVVVKVLATGPQVVWAVQVVASSPSIRPAVCPFLGPSQHLAPQAQMAVQVAMAVGLQTVVVTVAAAVTSGPILLVQAVEQEPVGVPVVAS